MKKILSIIFYFAVSFSLYLLLVNSLTKSEVLVSTVISGTVGILMGLYYPISLKFLNPIRLFWILVYLPFFIKEVIIANFKIALIVLNPKMPINPKFIKGKINLKSNIGKLILANSITLTPGTLSADIKDDELLIHCVKVEDSAEHIILKFEKYISRITE